MAEHAALAARARRRRLRRALAASILAAAVFDAFAQETPDAQAAAIVRRSSLDLRTRGSLEAALRIAIRKLESSTCRDVVSAFPGAWNPPPPPASQAGAILGGIRFRNGMPYEVCRDSRILAFTHPGAGEVFLCGETFNHAAFFTPEFAANILIHEALHTLGLRENPPTPGEITARIAAACRTDAPPDAHDDGASGDGARSNRLNGSTEFRIGGRTPENSSGAVGVSSLENRYW